MDRVSFVICGDGRHRGLRLIAVMASADMSDISQNIPWSLDTHMALAA